jgi:hypothetical protein
MPVTNFPNGLSSFGQVLGLANSSLPNVNGATWFVGASGASDGNSGGDIGQSFATIQKAIDVAQEGDTIVVFPGSYAENLVVNGKNYLSIIGAQAAGYARPDIVPASGKALYVEASEGFIAQHLRFAAPAADTDLVLHEGNGFRYEDCVFDGDAAQGNAKALLRLKGNATDDAYTASEGVILNCLFRGSGGDGVIFDTAAALVGVGETDVQIAGCIFVGNDQIDIATADTGAGTYSIQRGVIGPRNVFEDKNKTTYIDLTTSNGGAAGDQSGTIVGNFFAADAIDGTRVKMAGTAFTFVGNLDTVGVVDGSGLD